MSVPQVDAVQSAISRIQTVIGTALKALATKVSLLASRVLSLLISCVGIPPKPSNASPIRYILEGSFPSLDDENDDKVLISHDPNKFRLLDNVDIYDPYESD